MCSQLISISNSSQGFTPLGGMSRSLNTPGHPIMATKRLLKLPSTEMKKPQLPIITFLIIFQIQHYFVSTLSTNNSPEKYLKET